MKSRDFSEASAWINSNQESLWIFGIISIISFLAILILVPIFIVRLPADYFLSEEKPKETKKPGALGWILRILKNVLGVVLVLAGLAMLFLPGQGVLTILIGLMITDFPGKRSLERRIVQRPSVEQAVNWVRRNAGKPPLKLPDSQKKEPDSS